MRENSITKRGKLTKIGKFKLIYASKLKSNVIGQNIRMKTCNLTLNHAQDDPINCQIKAFHSAMNSSLSLNEISISTLLGCGNESRRGRKARYSRIDILKRFD